MFFHLHRCFVGLSQLWLLPLGDKPTIRYALPQPPPLKLSAHPVKKKNNNKIRVRGWQGGGVGWGVGVDVCMCVCVGIRVFGAICGHNVGEYFGPKLSKKSWAYSNLGF